MLVHNSLPNLSYFFNSSNFPRYSTQQKTAPKGFDVFRFFLFQKLLFFLFFLCCLLGLLPRPSHPTPHRFIRIFLNLLQLLTPLPSIRTIQLPLFFRFLPLATLEQRKSQLQMLTISKLLYFSQWRSNSH